MSVPRARPPPAISLAEAFRFWLQLGLISFGGPAGQIAIMHRELVEKRRWVSEKRFLHALNFCMVLPGPEAQQLATYLGWLMHRTWGGVLAGALFVLPSLALLIGLSWVYMAFGQQPLVVGLFYGIKPAVAAFGSTSLHSPGEKRRLKRTVRASWRSFFGRAIGAASVFLRAPGPWMARGSSKRGTARSIGPEAFASHADQPGRDSRGSRGVVKP